MQKNDKEFLKYFGDLPLYIFDFEVTKYDWLVVIKSVFQGHFTIIHNDNDLLKAFLNATDPVLVGFNNKHYDQYIMKAILLDFDPTEVKEINDTIINKGIDGWKIESLRNSPKLRQIDLMDDTQAGFSLKSYEAHSFQNIKESDVSFDIDRPWTEQELEEMTYYCKCDVNATEKLFFDRFDYLKNKIVLGTIKGMDKVSAMYLTNAGLTAKYLDASPIMNPDIDAREYKIPSNLLIEYIPKIVLDYIELFADKDLPDEQIAEYSASFSIGDCKVKVAQGGIHGAIENYRETATEDRVILNADVGSYYPHLMTIDGYCSRAIPNPKIFEDVLETRMKAKKAGDKATANALKLVVNTTYGCMGFSFSPLYDPLNRLSVCLTGQLRLLELTMHIITECPSVIVIQLNTDGIMLSVDKTELDKCNELLQEWQDRTQFTLEVDNIKTIIQKDVSNYIEVQLDGTKKIKGGTLVRGTQKAGAMSINNSATIIPEAIIEYLVNGTPIAETIGNCDDILKYQIIAKASSKYSGVWQTQGDKIVQLQKCNRIYASKDTSYGTLFKVHKTTGADEKVAGLPLNCIVDNELVLTTESIDKEWYIAEAQRLADSFIADDKKMKSPQLEELSLFKEVVSMANEQKTTRNVWQKLILARKKFLENGVKKSGKNMAIQFFYFELEDIVPKATDIFNELGLVSVVNFTIDTASMKIINTDNGNEVIEFTSPMAIPEPNRGTNAVQCLGSAHTYMRRYLYMMALDIVEKDQIDGMAGATTDVQGKAEVPIVPQAKEQPKITVSQDKREEITKELTNADGQPDELQLKALKAALKKLKTLDPSKDAYVQEIVNKTNKFADLTKDKCEKLILKINEQIKTMEGTENNG